MYCIVTRTGPKIPAAGQLEGEIFWDLWINFGSLWEENSLTEEHPDFFKLILRGCFGLQKASEAKSDLTNGFFLANYHFLLRYFGYLSLQKLVGWGWRRKLQHIDLLPQVKIFWDAGTTTFANGNIAGWKLIQISGVPWICTRDFSTAYSRKIRQFLGQGWLAFFKLFYSAILCFKLLCIQTPNSWGKGALTVCQYGGTRNPFFSCMMHLEKLSEKLPWGQREIHSNRAV